MQDYVIDHLDHTFEVFQTINPENLQFVLNDEDISTITYEISLFAEDTSGDPVITGADFISPWQTHWQLRYGPDIIIAAGVHSSVNVAYGGNFLKVAGVDWVGYLNRRQIPFDGRSAHVNDYVIDSPPQGFEYEKINIDIADIMTAILDVTLGRTNSIPFTYSLDATGIIIPYYTLDLADTSKILSIIQDLGNYDVGTAWEITPDKVFQIASPRWYGDPTAIANDSSNANLIYTIDEDDPPVNLDFTNTGPEQTHIQGEGDGSTTREAVTLGNLANQEVYWRTDGAYQYQNTITRDAVAQRTQERLAFGLNPIHEIPVTVDPNIIDTLQATDGFFWTNFKPGRAVWIDIPLGNGYHHIQSAHHIVSMSATLTDGNMLVDLSFNQIYDTSGEASVEEG